MYNVEIVTSVLAAVTVLLGVFLCFSLWIYMQEAEEAAFEGSLSTERIKCACIINCIMITTLTEISMYSVQQTTMHVST